MIEFNVKELRNGFYDVNVLYKLDESKFENFDCMSDYLLGELIEALIVLDKNHRRYAFQAFSETFGLPVPDKVMTEMIGMLDMIDEDLAARKNLH